MDSSSVEGELLREAIKKLSVSDAGVFVYKATVVQEEISGIYVPRSEHRQALDEALQLALYVGDEEVARRLLKMGAQTEYYTLRALCQQSEPVGLMCLMKIQGPQVVTSE